MKKEINSFIFLASKGLYCPDADIWIDPIKPVKNAIITHAHFDHVSIGCETYICSSETGLILKGRLGDDITIKTYNYEEEFLLNGIKISLHPSGHILGSSQVKFQVAGETWLITGDFKREKDETCAPFKRLETDVLICESTFGLPIFNWDNNQEIGDDISNWINSSRESSSILFCYTLGKAQRLLSKLKNSNIKEIYCHKSISKINSIYRRIGINIIDTKIFEKNSKNESKEGSLFLLPPSLNNKRFLKRFDKYQTAFASGWMSIRALRKRSGFDKGFILSDHADWNALVKTIKESKATKVFLNHGDGENLAKFLNETENIDIEELKFSR